jgi:hypothetical protein
MYCRKLAKVVENSCNNIGPLFSALQSWRRAPGRSSRRQEAAAEEEGQVGRKGQGHREGQPSHNGLFFMFKTGNQFQNSGLMCFRQISSFSESGLPDGTFSNRKSKFGQFLKGRAKENGSFYGNLIYFTAIRNILWTFGIYCGNLVYFSPFWYVYIVVIWYIFSRFGKLYLEKSGNREASRNWNKSCSLTFDAEEWALMPKKKQNIFFWPDFFFGGLKIVFLTKTKVISFFFKTFRAYRHRKQLNGPLDNTLLSIETHRHAICQTNFKNFILIR